MNLVEFQYNEGKWYEIGEAKWAKRHWSKAEDFGNGLELRTGTQEFEQGGEPWNGDTKVVSQ